MKNIKKISLLVLIASGHVHGAQNIAQDETMQNLMQAYQITNKFLEHIANNPAVVADRLIQTMQNAIKVWETYPNVAMAIKNALKVQADGSAHVKKAHDAHDNAKPTQKESKGKAVGRAQDTRDTNNAAAQTAILAACNDAVSGNYGYGLKGIFYYGKSFFVTAPDENTQITAEDLKKAMDKAYFDFEVSLTAYLKAHAQFDRGTLKDKDSSEKEIRDHILLSRILIQALPVFELATLSHSNPGSEDNRNWTNYDYSTFMQINVRAIPGYSGKDDTLSLEKIMNAIAPTNIITKTMTALWNLLPSWGTKPAADVVAPLEAAANSTAPVAQPVVVVAPAPAPAQAPVAAPVAAQYPKLADLYNDFTKLSNDKTSVSALDVQRHLSRYINNRSIGSLEIKENAKNLLNLLNGILAIQPDFATKVVYNASGNPYNADIPNSKFIFESDDTETNLGQIVAKLQEIAA